MLGDNTHQQQVSSYKMAQLDFGKGPVYKRDTGRDGGRISVVFRPLYKGWENWKSHNTHGSTVSSVTVYQSERIVIFLDQMPHFKWKFNTA